MLTFLKTLILAVVLAGITFMGYCTWKYKGIAYNELVYLLRKWRGRQVSSVKDRVKRKIKLILLLLAVSASLSYAKPNTATEVQGVHNGKFTPVPESQVVPIIVKQSTEYVGPTATPTPTFTWNATTTLTQPPTSTPTATNTPGVDDGYIWQQAITVTSPVPGNLAFNITTMPAYYSKISAVVLSDVSGGVSFSATCTPAVHIYNREQTSTDISQIAATNLTKAANLNGLIGGASGIVPATYPRFKVFRAYVISSVFDGITGPKAITLRLNISN